MTNKKRILITSFSVIILCLCILVGFSYALFTDSVKVTTHLKAGDLDIKLARTELVYVGLDEKGYLVEQADRARVDFTNSTSAEQNIFGLDKNTEVLMAPKCYYQATLELENDSNVAIQYTVKIHLTENANEFAEQLKVTLNDTVGKTFDEIKELDPQDQGYIIYDANGKDVVIEAGQTTTFTVKVEFLDVPENNDAKNQKFTFDLSVEAVQYAEIIKK